MTKLNTALKVLLGIALAVLVVANIAVIVRLLPRVSELGGTAGGMLAENYIPYVMYNDGYKSAKDIQTTAALTVGSSGTAVSAMITGTCNLVGQSGSDTIVAGGVATTSCAVSGVTTGDKVFASLPPTGNMVFVGQTSASSSAGFITVVLNNATSTASQVTKVGTSTQYWVVR